MNRNTKLGQPENIKSAVDFLVTPGETIEDAILRSRLPRQELQQLLALLRVATRFGLTEIVRDVRWRLLSSASEGGKVRKEVLQLHRSPPGNRGESGLFKLVSLVLQVGSILLGILGIWAVLKGIWF